MDVTMYVVHVHSVFTNFIYMVFFPLCSDVFPFSLFLRLSLCHLYSHMLVQYLIYDWNIPSYSYEYYT
jgi:hypothetical protein